LRDVTDVVDDKPVELGQPLELFVEPEFLFGPQQLLYELAAGREVDGPAGLNEFLADGAQQMGLAAAGLAEGEDVLFALEEAAFEQRAHLQCYAAAEAFQLEGAKALLRGDAGSAREAFNAVLAPQLAFRFTQGQQVGLAAHVFAAGGLA
jgi:hypothetical protein